MIISDLNYLEITSEEILGGYKKPVINKPKIKYFSSIAQADADASASGGTNNVAVTYTNAVVTPTSATASSSSYASVNNKP
ncbi:hypothetical protein [Nostoc sp. 'Peltigera malacea cyanobiont' DB3992]|uniref:hypothetical protein n=1 Tax=Nostoc sp. 'Peltigera malacea cyanobiont' DB3992 TaxID=1206980 RepID=UPI000C0529DE|nr:hypothetical protein [Nostoc sp. 'Peltigera malacea cyanobiont' DB3992]PHM10817.1 hypothetical protein CK516_06250 [Nostoc sp. 'Peltigera malacea cyanobiont' DB3992]